MDKVIRKPRIAISSEALQIIKIWATLENKTADEKLSELVISTAPQRVKELVVSEVPRVKKKTYEAKREPIEGRDDEIVTRNVTSVEEITTQERREREDIKATIAARPIRLKEQKVSFNLVGPLHDNFEAQAEIIRLYNEGVAIRQMDKYVGYPGATIQGFINKKIKSGELVKRSE
jgi:hypothetical protein